MLTPQTKLLLAEENRQFAGTGGVSEGNAQTSFTPAFQDAGTGQIAISRFKDGRPAPFHLLDGLPEPWVLKRDLKGCVVEVKETVISGFVLLGQFFTRQQASDFMAQHSPEGI